MLTKKDKEKIIEELLEKIKNSKSVVLSDYRGLEANEVRDLRDTLRKEGIEYRVFKKSLIQIALNKLEIKADLKKHEGPVAMAFSKEDEVLAAKLISDFSKKNEELEIVSAILENNYLAKQEVINLSKLPGKEELLAKVVGTINAPITGFVSATNGIIRNFVGVVDAIRNSKE
ncbi:MAG: 50S ribosomal protein L10 [Candidatus Moranbacteria bacterium]|nr:50S ribosomal protein L10 [Candidatus Moranbacteria bacterium]